MKYFNLNFNMRWLSFARRRWYEDRTIIFDFNRSLTLIVDPDSLMASIAARIKELFRLERVIILRELSEPGILTVIFTTDSNSDELESIRLSHEAPLAKWLLINESPLIVDKGADIFNYLNEAERKMLTRFDVRACVPLPALNRLTGVMLICSSDKRWKMSDYDSSLLQMLMGSASIALENAFLYQQQRDRMRRLYRAERLAAAGQLAASVAHEIRNPLTSISSTIQYILGDFEEGNPKRELIKGVLAEVDRIDQTVDGMLSLTRSTDFKPEPIALGELIARALLLVKAQVDQQSIKIEYSKPSLEIYIQGDASQIKQLLLNLIINALQAMPKGGTLKINLYVESKSLGASGEKNWTRISITDTGCGIPAANLDRIFDPFFTTKKEGTGLGLFNSYGIAQQHGGELEVSSRENEGTVVTVRFPLMKVDTRSASARTLSAK